MTSNDEIYLSYLCDQILVACNRIHKKLDKYDEFLSSYTTPVISYHEQPSWHVATEVVQPRPPPDPPNGQPELYRHQFNPYPAAQPPSWQTPPPPPQHYFHNQPSTSPTTYQQPPLTSAATATSLLYQNHQPPPPYSLQPLEQAQHQPDPQCGLPNFGPPPPPPCWDATDRRVSSRLLPAHQLLDWQQPRQLDMPLLEDPTLPRQPGPAPAFGLPISAAPRPYQPVTAPLLASMPHPQVVPSSMLMEWEPNMHEREEKTEIQVLVDEHKAPLETTKKDLEVGMEEKRRLFKDEHRFEHEELVFKKDVYRCAFVGDVVAHGFPKGLKENSFDGKIDSNISDDTNKQSKKAKEFFSTMDVLKIHHQLCARLKQMHSFDPGGDTSSKLLIVTFFALSWFPP